MNDFAVAMIKEGFDADVWSTAGEITLLGALRRDVWLVLPARIQGQVTSMSEIYVPRYMLAGAASRFRDSLDHARPGPVAFSAWMRVWPQVSLRITSDGVWDLEVNGLAFTLPPAVVRDIERDVDLWREVDLSIDQDGERYVLPYDTTHAGHPIDFSTRQPICAIAFEKRVRGKLDATDFGIYSAFCTMRDFPSSRRISDAACVDGRRFGVLVEGQSQRVFGAPVGTTAEGAETRSLEIDTDGNGQATIPLEAGQIRRIASGTPEFEYAKLSSGDLVSYSVGISPAGAGAIDVALLKSAASDSLMGNLRVGLARGMRLFTDDNSPETLRCVREAIATCATQDGWASFEYVWNRLYLLAKAGRGWDPGENGEGLVAMAQRHRSAFELAGEGAVPARIRVRGFDVR